MMTTAITKLDLLLAQLQPTLNAPNWVFCTMEGTLAHYLDLAPIATFQETEGLTLVLQQSVADQENLSYEGVFKQVTLQVHSSLNAVGLTAVVASKLAEHNISANVIAGYYHDHIFVPTQDAEQAVILLQQLAKKH